MLYPKAKKTYKTKETTKSKLIQPKSKYFIDILGSKNAEFFWIITHRNGNQIARSSETYRNKKDCRSSLQRLLDSVTEGDIRFSEDPIVQ